MNLNPSTQMEPKNIVTFYHDIEQDFDSAANPQKCRQVVKKFLEIEKKYGISATYNVVGKLYQKQPDLIKLIVKGGGELSFHSFNHQTDWNASYFSDEIDLCREISPDIPGYRSPRSQINEGAIQHLWEKGFKWTAEDDYYNSEPYFIHKGLVRLPIADDDWDLHTGKVSIPQWLDKFSTFIDERPYTAVGFHDCVAALAEDDLLSAWENAIQMATESGLLIVTFSEAADLFRRAALSKYYNETASKRNNDNKGSYRTPYLQDMIRSEAEKINNPVIASLGCGGDLLSRHFHDYVSQIYCVDNAENMLVGLESDVCETHVGDVTDSGLPEKSVDLIICDGVIEYLFWPNRLADEIKRIGKKGATYFVTFPTHQDTQPLKKGLPPDRIRYFFTLEEMREWACQIGPSKLYVVNNEKPESINSQIEQRYLEMEKHPPKEMIPCYWVLVGKIEKRYQSKEYSPVIPVSATQFKLRSQQHNKLKSTIRKLGTLFPKKLKEKGMKILLRF